MTITREMRKKAKNTWPWLKLQFRSDGFVWGKKGNCWRVLCKHDAFK